MRPTPIRFALLCVLFATPGVSRAAAPMPSRKFVHKEHGFLIKVIRDWSQTPTQPGEQVEVAKFKAKSRGTLFATLSIYRFRTAYGEITPRLEDEPILAAIRDTRGVALYAAEDDEWLSSTMRFCEVLRRKELPHTLSVWPAPADHHEHWWKLQLRRFLETRWPLG